MNKISLKYLSRPFLSRYLSAVLGCLAYLPSVGGAQTAAYNVPDLGGPVKIGRVTLYKTPSGISWLSPIAFSSRFHCTGTASDANASCILQLVNALTPDERTQLDQAIQAEGLQVTYFSSLDSRVVSGISERLDGPPALAWSSPILPGTLMMSDGRTFYGGVNFRTDRSTATRLAASYEGEGIGNFTVSYDLQTQTTMGFVGFRDGACVKRTLSATAGKGVRRSAINGLTDQVLSECGFVATGYDADDAAAMAHQRLVDDYFEWQGYLTGYRLRADKLQALTGTLELTRAMAQAEVLHCESTLSLKNGAAPATVCKDAGGNPR